MRKLVILAACACGSASPRAKAPATQPAGPDVRSLMRGPWLGGADTSPLGTIPYALLFKEDGGVITAETPPPPGGKLPKGAYQRFTFSAGEMTFEASLGEGKAEGKLTEQVDSPSRLVFCAVEGGCQKMQVVLEAPDGDHLKFTTSMGGTVHADIHLVKMGH
jgi:hypothetical protein